MSYTTLSQQVQDPELVARVNACVQQEARNNPTLSDTEVADQIRQGIYLGGFYWAVSIATEAAYEYAVNTGNEHPGGDETVITDGDILSAVQVNWPPDPP
jgi:hypothetical protein